MPIKGGSEVDAAGPPAGSLDALDAVEAAAREVARQQSLPEIIDAALVGAVELTRSPMAFLALETHDNGQARTVYSLAREPDPPLGQDEIGRILPWPAAPAPAAPGAPWTADGANAAP